jgi:hypothetical protein
LKGSLIINAAPTLEEHLVILEEVFIIHPNLISQPIILGNGAQKLEYTMVLRIIGEAGEEIFTRMFKIISLQNYTEVLVKRVVVLPETVVLDV